MTYERFKEILTSYDIPQDEIIEWWKSKPADVEELDVIKAVEYLTMIKLVNADIKLKES